MNFRFIELLLHLKFNSKYADEVDTACVSYLSPVKQESDRKISVVIKMIMRVFYAAIFILLQVGNGRTKEVSI